MKDLIPKMPKIELHCHLDGSIQIPTIQKMAQNMNIPFPTKQEEIEKLLIAPEETKDLNEYLEKFDYVGKLLQTKENLTLAAKDVLEQAKQDNVKYIEVRFAPTLHTQQGLTLSEVVEAVLVGLKQGEVAYGVKANALLCGMRHESVETATEIAELSKKFQKNGVAGFDLAGNEADFPPTFFKEALAKANELGVNITLHAGECHCAKNVYDSVILGAKRIGHGVALIDNPEYMAFIKEKEIVLEMAPTSNFQTKTVSKLEDYPLKKFLDYGIKVCINTDNRTVSQTNLNQEYQKLHDWYQLTIKDFETMNLNACFGAFLDEEEKKMLEGEILDGFLGVAG